MKYFLQIFTGNFAGKAPETAGILRVLTGAMDALEVEGVILGWSTDTAAYAPVLEEIHRRGKTAWLWLPVFSDLPPWLERDPSLTLTGKVQGGIQVTADEDFAFVCPNSEGNRAHPIHLYREHFAHLPFDGVFLDKIRHASFSGGLESALGCFCPRCRQRYREDGIEVEGLGELIRTNPRSLLPGRVEEGRMIFDHPLVDGLYRRKAAWITQAVADIAAELRREGLKIGLDVYAPMLAYGVGQDILALSQHADFLKPMLYRITLAPAGLPYEIDCMRQSLLPLGIDPLMTLQRLWGARELIGEEAVQRQLEQLAGAACPVYPGFEINVVPELCHSSPAYVQANRTLYSGLGVPGAVLSWNLLADTGANILALKS